MRLYCVLRLLTIIHTPADYRRDTRPSFDTNGGHYALRVAVRDQFSRLLGKRHRISYVTCESIIFQFDCDLRRLGVNIVSWSANSGHTKGVTEPVTQIASLICLYIDGSIFI
jgi:hypothetical protein